MLLADSPWDGAAKRFREAKKKSPGQLREIESSFNFTEVPYLFAGNGRDASDEEDRQLAGRIAEAWRAWLHHRYPGRRFCVEVIPPEEAGSVVSVSFYERR